MIGPLTFRVDGTPATKGSWRVFVRGGKPSLVADNPGEPVWAQLVAWSARAALRNRLEPDRRRYRVRAVFTLPPSPGGRAHRKNRRDLDKLVRSILDALTGIVWLDDEQVDEVLTCKGIGTRPGVEIMIEEIKDPDAWADIHGASVDPA